MLTVLLGVVVAFAHSSAHSQARPNAFDLNIEELGQVQITTVSRRPETRREAAASVYVITAEDIRRSGVTSLAEALRLAPGVEVARNGSSEWTISIRGFNSDLSNKLLVLIDGRSVYSPLFAGVFWDVQDTLLPDIERIEVVAGPGGTLWGANAVNGVVNIITRSAVDTEGSLVSLSVGDEDEVTVGFRRGWKISDALAARAFVKLTERDAARFASGADAVDDWRSRRAGFALQWLASGNDTVDVRANTYVVEKDALVRGDFSPGTLPGPSTPGMIDLNGLNVVFDWRRTIGDGAGFGVQAYYDRTDRQIPNSFNEARDTWDVAFQHDLADIGRHDLQWGGEIRATKDRIGNTVFAAFTPANRSDQTFSAFLQDRLMMRDERLFLTLGAKVEENDYTGRELQPNLRLTWLPSERHTVWGAVSRAVRVPARLNTDLELFAPIGAVGGTPFYVNVVGADSFESEEVVAYEAGYRLNASETLSVDLALFDNYYDRLQTQEMTGFTLIPGPPQYIILGATLGNLMEGEVYGGTVAVTWQPYSRWRLQMHYAHLQIDLRVDPNTTDPNAVDIAGNSPKTQAAVRSFIDLTRNISLYTSARYVAELRAQAVPSYLAVDWGIEWQPTARPLRVSLHVRNANDRLHAEFGGNVLVERSALARVEWQF